MRLREALQRALAEGATEAEIIEATNAQLRHVGTRPFNNMIIALQLMPWRNTRSDWVRLAGALNAKALNQ